MTNTREFLANPRTALGVLGAYFTLHLVLRTLVSDSLQTDEAEQVFVTQVWRWGYGSQPPLYTWLQNLMFAVCGLNVFALALQKNLLLFSVYAFTYLTGRAILREPRHAVMATLSLLLIPLLMWESQRDQTHLVLATAISAATWFVASRLFQTRKPLYYVILGGVFGLGILAKYNYAFLIVALLAAALSLPQLRSAVFDRKILLTLGCLLLVVAPHGCWAWFNPGLVLSQTNKFNLRSGGDASASLLVGGIKFLISIFQFTVAPLLFYGLLCFRARAVLPATADPALVKLLRRTLVVGLLLCLAPILVFHVTRILDRWLQPLLFVLPLLLVAQAQSRLDWQRVKVVFAVAATAMLVVPTIMYGTVVAADWTGWRTNLNLPYRAFAAQIRAAGFVRGVIIVKDHAVAGNLRLSFPDSTVMVPNNIQLPFPRETAVLFAWLPGKESVAPPELIEFVARECHLNLAVLPVREAAAPALYTKDVQCRLYFALAHLAPGEESK